MNLEQTPGTADALTPEAVVETAPNSKFVPVTLDDPIMRGDNAIGTVTLRKPMAGELRGLSLDDLIGSDITTLLKLLPRITDPFLTDHEVAQLSPVDLGQMGGAVRGFFMTKEQSAIMKKMIEDSSSRN
ncbi:MAG: phage tail assembly protein [Proteobacteria bacterium]|nr:phage tail assembly protein [Pseudomonadota bacterium]